MKKKIKMQAYSSVMIAAALAISINSDIEVLNNGANRILSYMETNYTVEDAKRTLSVGADYAREIPSKLAGTVKSIKGDYELADPIDPGYVAGETKIYAVLGGDVTATGENEEIGKYIKITHGNIGESLYGNLKKINVESPSRINKGQQIATFEAKEDEEFYFSFKEFD